ncbi:hypothetical protein HIO71_17140 [Chryseobacterium aquaticum]|uniref:DUF6705 domain-containing protein n=1 Tax=Chryseobacterium aquaticum TaxID=452084 RepID=A0A848N689_9FLAO|nr:MULTISPECIES: DUF6705 family protein [Chryseobacterium]NMR35906.1 hypothetical protein [Chryseobacterium aquaticum]NRQ47981.1 hypothetical protein [Chryseobacterium sp. C-204]
MKNYLIIILTFILMACKAQSPVYTLGQSPVDKLKNSYVKDTNNVLNKFSGTWIYSQNGQVFTVNLQKAEMVFLINYFVDELLGNYKYSINNNTIVNTILPDFSGKKSRIFGFTIWEGNPNKVTLFFRDPERPRVSCQVDLTYSNQGGIEKLNWELRVTGILPQGVPGKTLNPATDVRVPTNMELIKQ